MKLTIHEIKEEADKATAYVYTHYFNHRTKITAKGYSDDGIEVTVILKIPKDNDNVPKIGQPLNVSVSFDEFVTTTKTTKII
jgi:hypothetical protein